MKKILGLDLGTNSIGWALVEHDSAAKQGKILGMGSRIIPMSQEILGKFDSGQSISQTADRTRFRGIRRLLERDLLRRERLHRVLNVLGFLPEHYAADIDFEHRLGQFNKGKEPKLNYKEVHPNKYEFIFEGSFNEMLADFRTSQPQLFYKKSNGKETKIPYDWTIYYLRKKALTQKIGKEELAWILLNFNQKRGYYQLRGEEESEDDGKQKSFEVLKVVKVVDSGEKIRGKNIPLYDVYFDNDWKYDRQITKPEDWEGKTKEFIVTVSSLSSGEIKRTFKAVNSEQDWIAIKQKTEQSIDNSGKTVGQYIYDTLLLNPDQKIRGKLVRTIERKFYKNELRQILEKQKEFHAELQSDDLYRECLEELYPCNDAHKNNIANRDFTYLFIDDIIFYQRPLKSKKSLISKCALESRTYRLEDGTEKKEGIKCISKSNPLYQEFRLLQWMKNLKIFRRDDKNEIDITGELLPTEEAWLSLYHWLNDKAEIDQNAFLKYDDFGLEETIRKQLGMEQFRVFKNDKEQGLHTYFRWNFVENKQYPLNETRGDMIKRLNKAKIGREFLTLETEKQLWHILYSVEDKNEIESALRKFASKHHLPEVFVETFKRFPRIDKEYGAYSEKAIKKLLPLMRFGSRWNWDEIHADTKDRIDKILTGEFDEKIKSRVREKAIHLHCNADFKNLPLWLASYIVYNRHSEAADIQYWHTADHIELLKQHSLRNPIVEQIINETLQTIKAIWENYGNGEKDFFDEIHVELGREMKNPADKRRQMTERVAENENTNIRLKNLLVEFLNDGNVENVRPYSPMQQEILKIYEEGIYNNETNENWLEEIGKIRKKNQPTSGELKRYKLWLEQGYKSPYTGEMIPLSKLFTPAYEIEHIIPQSRFFDDSLSNKIICEAEVNAIKDNQLAYEFIKKNAGLKIELSHGKFVKLLSSDDYEDNVKKYFAGNKLKSKREKLLLEEIPEKFIERQLNDSRYISKVVKSLLSNMVRQEGEEDGIAKNVVVSSGGITSRLKADWGLNNVWNELITPRFERLNNMVGYEKYGCWESKDGKRIFQINTLEPELYKLNKKRIDHRHHALDALIVACSSRSHINYLNNESAAEKKKSERFDLRNKLRRLESFVDAKGNQRTAAKEFYKPWETFTQDAKSELHRIIVSFKKNNRVINKTVNYYQKWERQSDGSMKKVFAKQTKGDSWAIRKPLHEKTISALVDLPWIKLAKDEFITATRKALDTSFDSKKILKITDTGIQKILQNYLKVKGNPENAFSYEGIEELNERISLYNDNVPHKPINKVRVYEKGKGRFKLGNCGSKATKFVQGAPNLFYGVYTDEVGNRFFSTIPFDLVIERQKQGLTSCPEVTEDGKRLLFDLSPNDLVYVPTIDEQENPQTIDFNSLSKSQVERVFVVNDFSGATIYFTPNNVAKNIAPKEIDLSWNEKKKQTVGSFDTKTATLDGQSIKNICWKLEVNRLGKVTKVIR
ncbi:MAG: type II CRISPR RNA-guided endonuclease Cas9 [Bacteroidales bacterium]|nr:type II CRISPR RNA-guided endonuclease Cas9 [Bacteroidales bacterium]MBN2748776.1 type II CRISPR RNA-guided endonuclease Cas9 [Bacteroidales bacterium]